MLFNMIGFKRTEKGLEMMAIGMNQEHVIQHPHIWLKDNNVLLIAAPEELMKNSVRLYVQALTPLPGYWTSPQIIEFTHAMLEGVQGLKWPGGWVDEVTKWDTRFSRDEQDQARIESEMFDNLVF